MILSNFRLLFSWHITHCVYILKAIFYFIELCVVFEYLKNILQHLAIVYISSFAKHIKNYKPFFTQCLSFFPPLSFSPLCWLWFSFGFSLMLCLSLFVAKKYSLGILSTVSDHKLKLMSSTYQCFMSRVLPLLLRHLSTFLAVFRL